jgi:MoxR-like ATPase
MAVVKKRPAPKAVEHANNVDQAVSDGAEGLALATVPERQYYDSYISREVNGVLDMDVLKYAFTNGINVLISGPTGPGKTSLLLAYAARSQKRFYSVASNLALDPSQMFGKWGMGADGKFHWYDGGVTDIVRNGGVLLINEVNFLSDRIAPVLYELLDKRREITLLDHKGEKIRAHRPGCWCDLDAKECQRRWVLIVADMNPDYSGTRPLNHAFRNRFAIQLDWDYDPAIEARLVKSTTLREIVERIRKHPNIDTPVPTNAMVEFEKIARDLSVDWAVSNFISHFSPDEQPAIKGAIDILGTELKDDFAPELPGAEDWDQYAGDNGAWIDEDVSDDQDEWF